MPKYEESKRLSSPPTEMSTNIIGLAPTLTERGRVKIGAKGERAPVRFNHFLITTSVRGADDNFIKDEALHQKLEATYGKEPKAIPIRFLSNDIDLIFQSNYGSYPKGKLFCRGDGRSALRNISETEQAYVTCPCVRLNYDYDATDKCKFNGRLNFIIEGAQGLGGIWTFRTASRNSVEAIQGSLALMVGLTQGQLANVPFHLVVHPKTTRTPAGVRSTIQVVSIEWRGDAKQLLIEAFEAQKMTIVHRESVLQLESRMRDHIKSEPIISDADLAEFYHQDENGTEDGGTDTGSGASDVGAVTTSKEEGRPNSPKSNAEREQEKQQNTPSKDEGSGKENTPSDAALNSPETGVMIPISKLPDMEQAKFRSAIFKAWRTAFGEGKDQELLPVLQLFAREVLKYDAPIKGTADLRVRRSGMDSPKPDDYERVLEALTTKATWEGPKKEQRRFVPASMMPPPSDTPSASVATGGVPFGKDDIDPELPSDIKKAQTTPADDDGM